MLIKNEAWKASCLLVCTLLIGISTQCQSRQSRKPKWPPATVTHIVDGDTFDMIDSARHTIRIRPIGINADEMKDNAHGKKGPFAQTAKNYLSKLILHKKVRLVTNIGKRDRYRRLLAYVYVDTIFVNAAMLKAGLAMIETQPPNIRYASYL